MITNEFQLGDRIYDYLEETMDAAERSAFERELENMFGSQYYAYRIFCRGTSAA
ncbi:hypothetical protein [Desulfosporosinus sp. BICA1-9]|uniref:hypothetical protein n=1 Tax=Desulfosporosinus sp. BICA1-9 TaxID=1531958 RepID=UPI000AAA4D57|nr:hypothetical protein [Desulfosporosinus sp. BICA1-9]